MPNVSTKAVLRKVANKEGLTAEEKKDLKKLVSILKNALKGDALSRKDRKQIKELIEKSESGKVTPYDFITICKGLFHLVDIFKDYS